MDMNDTSGGRGFEPSARAQAAAQASAHASTYASTNPGTPAKSRSIKIEPLKLLLPYLMRGSTARRWPPSPCLSRCGAWSISASPTRAWN
jgi:hypothetical protein